ncbi:sensor histidine kinase [Filimonas lacunae]|uniref:sensor histidine kinase n=1 Tax=Filimonas lacunae TaxID=477680 RepID=UPI00190EC0F0|nr:sensor histidine kinase [Filimonas lacunae]
MQLTISYNTSTAIVSALLLLALCAIILLYVRLRKAQHHNRQYAEKYKELELKVHSLQLESINYKLNPHLFKNILNSIQSHAYQTYYALDKLSNVLDYILYESDRQYVSLREEIEFALSLIEINRIKVSPLFDLRIKNKTDESNTLLDQKLIAPLITIDLIENAFKHADLQSENAFIAIVFELKGPVFTLTVSNKISSKSPLKKQKGGFGKDSLQKRLSVIYQQHYELDQFAEGDVYIAHLKINLLEHKNKMLATG